MNNGNTLWENLQNKYKEGVSMTHLYKTAWQGLRGYIDDRRWKEVDVRMDEQVRNAEEWHDTCIAYFSSFQNKK